MAAKNAKSTYLIFVFYVFFAAMDECRAKKPPRFFDGVR